MNFYTWKLMVPYGKWICDYGKSLEHHVFFNRNYWPILEIVDFNPLIIHQCPSPDIYACDMSDWIAYDKQVYFFNDWTQPFHGPTNRRRQTLANINYELRFTGLTLPPRPRWSRNATPPYRQHMAAKPTNPWLDYGVKPAPPFKFHRKPLPQYVREAEAS